MTSGVEEMAIELDPQTAGEKERLEPKWSTPTQDSEVRS